MKKQNRFTTTLPANIGKYAISLFPGYISNGHWVIARGRVNNREMFASEAIATAYLQGKPIVREVSSDDAIKRINAGIGLTQSWTGTSMLHEHNGSLERFFIRELDGALALFDCAYLKLFGLNKVGSVLWGEHSKQVFRDTVNAESMTLLIMPISFDLGLVKEVFGRSTQPEPVKV